MMPDAAVWEDIRLAYETTSETVVEIAARHGIHRSTILSHAKAHGWTLRPSGTASLLIANANRAAGITPSSLTATGPKPKAKTKAKAKARAASAQTSSLVAPLVPPPKRSKSKSSGGSRTHQRAIIERLYDVTDAKLSVIESRIAAGTALKATDAERESREIASILKTIEKLKDLLDAFARTNAKSGEPKPGTAAANAAAGLADDAERLRQDLAERFYQLGEQRRREQRASKEEAKPTE